MKKSSLYSKMNSFIQPLIMLLLLAVCATAQAEQQFVLTEEEWSRPRSATVVKSYPAMQKTVQAWLLNPRKQSIELRYPGGEEGSLWAEEIKDWLISMGIPSNKLETYPGHPQQAEVALVVLP